ncbi:hypothetical protein [Acidovorax sp.]|uniref:hypothetical protein n=1 Tax=Acidovorax sp. TaxID=1872122 RepID=UPI00391F5083
MVMMTGYAEQLARISQLGFDVLTKPCTPQMLHAAIGKAGGEPCMFARRRVFSTGAAAWRCVDNGMAAPSPLLNFLAAFHRPF